MSIVLYCKSCGKKLRVPESAAGKKGQCNGCKATMTIPAQSETEPVVVMQPDEAPEPISPKQAARELVSGSTGSAAPLPIPQAVPLNRKTSFELPTKKIVLAACLLFIAFICAVFSNQIIFSSLVGMICTVAGVVTIFGGFRNSSGFVRSAGGVVVGLFLFSALCSIFSLPKIVAPGIAAANTPPAINPPKTSPPETPTASTSTASDPPKMVAPETVATKPPTEKAPYHKGEQFALGNFSYRINDVTKTTSVGSEFVTAQASDGCTFLGVQYTIRNNANESQTVLADDFKLVDAKGRRFSPDSHATTTFAMSSGKKDLFVSQLHPGIQRDNTTFFEVPNDAVAPGLILEIPEKGVWGRNKVLVKLVE